MIYIYKINKEIEKEPKELVSRLTWKTHLVKYPYFVRTTKLREDTSRPFTGKIIENENRFIIKRMRSILQSFLPVFIVTGNFTNQGQRNILTLKFHLGFFSSLLLIYLLMPIVHIIYSSFKYGFQLNSLAWLILTLLVGFLAAFEIQNIKDKLFEILEIE